MPATMLSRSIILRAIFFALGFSPIASLSFSTFKLLPLHVSGPWIVFPAILLGALLSLQNPAHARLVAKGLLAGLVAVLLYDLTRVPFVMAGLWKDFIPKIGTYLLHSQATEASPLEWWVGYAWRYFGNGAGMGLGFFMIAELLPAKLAGAERSLRVWGTLYGVVIYCCLLVTIYASPEGRRYLFDPTLFTATLGLIGHLVYGFVLGSAAEMMGLRGTIHFRKQSRYLLMQELLNEQLHPG